MNNPKHAPHSFPGVTVSSTFSDLKEHRDALIHLIDSQKLKAIAMENDGAKLMDVIDSSLEMVRQGAAYIGVISHKYGQVPECPKRNPDNLSITELEFNEALRLKRPILLFVIGEGHPVLVKDVEIDPEKRKKLEAFRERAKGMNEDSPVHRVYATFNSLDHFKEQIGKSILEISDHLKAHSPVINTPLAEPVTIINAIPLPPALYAEPPYLGSHRFVGRKAQLDVLDDWAQPADPHTILLFEAIGGNGKSMLTWEWTTKHATKARGDWAGIFWYSFYEKGAIMADFCCRALCYMTGRPLEEFSKKKVPELKELLLPLLQEKPWLFILDGLERVLVAYHRIDAASIRDEELDNPEDKIVNRDPCFCINEEDDELLRALSAVAPSKLLVSSRLVPKALLNAANQPIPGVFRVPLAGLRPGDAEALFRSCRISGNAEAIQNYLVANCDCHPLTIGVLAGLVNDYLPDKGNFDAWLADPAGGGQLNLAELNLVQKRNHILKAALYALPEKSLELLSTMALLSEAVDYRVLLALNPHLPPEPVAIPEPVKPKEVPWISEEQKVVRRKLYEQQIHAWEEYQKELQDWRQSEEYKQAPRKLEQTIHDLEERGLLQYDRNTRRYDLHPVTRGIAAGGLQMVEKERYGQIVVDFFSAQAQNPYEQAESQMDIQAGINIVQVLLKMEHYQEAIDAYRGELSNALFFNLEAYSEVLALIKPFFPNGWNTSPVFIQSQDIPYLTNDAALALSNIGETEEALLIYEQCVALNIENVSLADLRNTLRSICVCLDKQNELVASQRVLELSLLIGSFSDDIGELFADRFFMFTTYVDIGLWEEAGNMWSLLDSMGRDWSRASYRPGDAEFNYVRFQFMKGELNEEHLAVAERLAIEGKNRSVIRDLYWQRGMWLFEQGEWNLAMSCFNRAVNMARAIGHPDTNAETNLALVKFKLNQLVSPSDEAERLARFKKPDHRVLSELWFAIGNMEEAQKHALQAYKKAWADGEPYVHRYELNKANELLERLGVERPDLPPYDPTKEEKFPWEDRVIAFVEKLKAEKERKETEEEE